MKKTQNALNPFVIGVKCRCPNCGEGPLFYGYLKVSKTCESCGTDLSFADSGDGPAIFIMFIVGFIIMVLAVLVDSLFHPPPMVHLMLWLPTTLVLSLALLPPFKAIMIALQYQHDAKEGRPD